MQSKQTKAAKIIATVVIICTIIVNVISTIVMASEEDKTTIEPSENQYFELRATQIKEVIGQNKQVTFELWGNDIEFKRI